MGLYGCNMPAIALRRCSTTNHGSRLPCRHLPASSGEDVVTINRESRRINSGNICPRRFVRYIAQQSGRRDSSRTQEPHCDMSVAGE